MEKFNIDDIVEDKNGKVYLVQIRNNRLAIIHEPTCGSEREGECKFDYIDNFTINHLQLEKVGTYELNSNLLNQ